MKLPKLPAECIRRLITTKTQERFPLEIARKTILAMVLGLCNPEPYTIEELDKLKILPTIIDATMYTCNEYNLTKEALELFDEIKSNSKALDYFMWRMSKLRQNLRKDPEVKQYILDTLVGPEWRQPDFYLYGDFSLRLIDKSLRRKKNISSILCDGLCIFDDIPKDRLNKFYEALRRLKPYIKRRGFRYTIDNRVSISYKSKDFPISMPKLIQQHTDMYLEWYIKNNQLIIEKTFKIYHYYYQVSYNELLDVLNRLKEKYPNTFKEHYTLETLKTLKEYSELPYTYDTYGIWNNRQEYNIPTDLEELTNT